MSDPDFPLWPSSDDAQEDDSPIQFFCEDIEFELAFPDKITTWLQEVVTKEGKQLAGVSYVFCSDEYLYQMNVDYLQHDTYTDVITFPYSDPPLVDGDIFISIDRVRENAGAFQSDFDRELRRVMVHGVLHLCGYKDKTEEEAEKMREKENEYLQLV